MTAAAAAAAILVVLLRPPAPLPGYQIAVAGGSSEMRGEQTEEFAPGDSIEVRLRPETATRGSLEAQLFLLQGDELRRLETRIDRDSAGSVKMNGSLDPDLQPGAWTLWAVVGRPGDLPSLAELRSLALQGEVRRRDWVAVSQGIRIQPRGP